MLNIQITEEQKDLITEEMTPLQFYAIVENEDEDDIFLTYDMKYEFLKAKAVKFDYDSFYMSDKAYKKENNYLLKS